ncbi:hypothetical protein HC761_01695 [bacterium]|nr:hypothetical protein [bacterium]
MAAADPSNPASTAALAGGAFNSGEVEDYSTADASTVPVTLSKVQVTASGAELSVNFSTATEAGTLGFRVLADIGKETQARVELGRVSSKSVDSLSEQSYSVRAANPGANQVWIEEYAIDGKAVLYGPYAIGSSVGETGLAQRLNWSAIQAEQQSFRSAQRSSLRASNAKAAELSVSEDGWVQVTHEALLAAGVDFSGEDARSIAVRKGSVTVPSRSKAGSFGAGSVIEFYATASDTLYTKAARYRIELGRSLSLASVEAQGDASATAVTEVQDQLLINPNRVYSFSAPIEDPWFSFRALRNGTATGVGSTSFTLSDRVTSRTTAVGVSADSRSDDRALSAEETLEVRFWGGLNYDGDTPDHKAVFKLNGQVLGEVVFDGFAARTARFSLPAGLLQSGANSFSVELPATTGYGADIVNVESLRIGYTRRLSAQNDRLNVILPAAEKASDSKEEKPASSQRVFEIDGLSGQPVIALLQRGANTDVLNVSAVQNGKVRIALDAQAGDRLIISPINRPALSASSTLLDPIQAGSSYLIISHPSFIGGLGSFISAKQAQGFSVNVVDVEALYRYYNAGQVDPAAIQAAIRRAASLGTTHVLLVGGDSYDYHNVLGVNSISFIPTHYRRTGPIIAYAPSDAVYADTDGDRRPNVALGRWPVRTMSELNAVISKTLAYRSSQSALFLSDRSLNGQSYAQELAPAAGLLGPSWRSSSLSLDSYAPGQAATARADLLSQLSEGSVSLLSYYGHSAPASWSREGLLTAAQVNAGLFSGVSRPFATLQLGCWGTYFVEPTSTTVAHSLLLQPQGAALILGASSLTESRNDLSLANGILQRSSQSFGEALKQTQGEIVTQTPDALDVIYGGAILGDPSLR